MILMRKLAMMTHLMDVHACTGSSSLRIEKYDIVYNIALILKQIGIYPIWRVIHVK